MKRIPHTIGALYRYPETNANSNNTYKLTDYFPKRGIFLFECGHWCTDNVFIDLKIVHDKTDKQLTLSYL